MKTKLLRSNVITKPTKPAKHFFKKVANWLLSRKPTFVGFTTEPGWVTLQVAEKDEF
jgi:hypothetical protein